MVRGMKMDLEVWWRILSMGRLVRGRLWKEVMFRNVILLVLDL